MQSKMLGVGSYVPEYRLTNAELERLVETSDEWIVQRTGIHERRIAKGKRTADMALAAAQQALADASVAPEELDLILVSTVTPDSLTPTVACRVQAALGAKNAAALDFNAACSGFVYAVEMADSYIRSGKKKRVLVISAERLHSVIDYTDRTTCVLFGDGAGAAVFAPSGDGSGVLSTYSMADGTMGDALYIGALPVEDDPFGASRPAVTDTRYLTMAGNDVFRFTATAVPAAIDKALEEAGKTADEVDWFVLHQANQRIIKMVAKKYGLDERKIYINMDRFGNTSSASVPLCLAEMKQKGLLHEGQLILLAGFGGGLTYGSALIRL